ncbi:multicopper oxidase domain-containing protein [Propionibacteriaceae bacterium G1746]
MFWMLALIVLAFTHRWVPQSRWLLVHMATLGIASNSIMVWGQHFADSLLHTRHDDKARAMQVRRLWALNLGILTACVGMIGAWPWVTTAGAVVVGLVFAAYAVQLVLQARDALPGRFGHVVRWYVCAAALLPVGATYGAVLSFSQPEPWQGRLLVAHVVVNMLGFVGLTATATLLTLWPTMLRTPMATWSERLHRVALPVLFGGVLVTAAAITVGWRWVAVVGLVAWLGGFVALAMPGIVNARRKPPRDFSTWSVAAAVSWVAGCVAWLLWQVASQPALDAERVKQVTVPLIVGGLVQLVLGAMSYLMPVVMGGGPSVVRAMNDVIGRGAGLRVTLVNAGLLAYLLVENSWALVVTSLFVFIGLASFVPLMIAMVRTFRREMAAKQDGALPPPLTPAERERLQADKPGRRDLLGAGIGLAGVAAAVVLLDGDRSSGGRQAEVPATGRTVEADISAEGMRFIPDHVVVAPGDRLVLHVVNNDPTQVHDLYFEGGATTGRLAPHQRADVDLGVVPGPVEGWCTIVGHKAMGMVFHVQTDAAATATTIDLTAAPGADYVIRDAVLPRAVTGMLDLPLVVQESSQEVAPGVQLKAMTYNGRVMGPPVVVARGTRIAAHLRNDGTMGHSIDFHAGDISPDAVMRTIPPGESLDYTFTVNRTGIWLYHCSTMPMSAHLAAGMYGAVVVPPEGLAKVDREYLLVQQDAYISTDGSVDTDKIAAEDPDLVMWNGHANQYVHAPLEASAGDRVRLWVLAAGPSRGCSFHVVGAQFDTVYKEGAYLLRSGGPGGTAGAQALDLAPAQGGFVEMVLREPGTYTFVNHAFVDAERGARGLIKVV